MADRIITAEVRINGQDAGVAEMLSKVATNIKRVDEVAAQSGQMQKFGRQMVELKNQMEAVGQLQSVQKNLGAMQTRAGEAAAKVEKLKTEMAAVAQPTAAMARALESAELASVKAAAAVVRQTEVVERNRRAVAEMGLSTANAVREQERLARSFQDTARAAEVTMRAEQKAEQAAAHLAKTSHAARGHGGHGSGLDVGGVVAGALAGHSFIHGAEQVMEVYRHFDKERRYGAVVMNLTPEQQAPLVEQAIHGGATSKFNDIQWLESQRELAMRGYNKDQVLGFTPIVAQIGQAFDVSMPEAVKALEGAMLGFGKDVSTFEKAQAEATRTADLEVKASKISGMSFEDIVALYKYAAAPAKMAHLSEESMLAYGAISKKSNMGGDESGVAFRALAKNLLTPTHEAQLAMQAAGIDFSKYQHAPDHLNTGGFVSVIAKEFGIKLDAETRGKLDKLFHDKAVIGDAAKFMPAVQQLLGDSLGGDDAKSKNKIAQKARAYRDASMESIDTNGLMAAIMEGISKSPALANAIFGSKQGGRIFAALGDPKFFHHILDELHNESGGFAQKVSADRMAGFDGAASKFEGAIKNFETAIGRAFDDGGKGGFMTHMTEGAAHFVQTLAEADPHLLQIGAAAAGLVGLWGSAKVVGLFSGGFGLKGSAVALDEAAAHLMMVGGGPGGAASSAAHAAEEAAGGAAGSMGWFAKLATGMGIAGAGIFVGDAMLNHRDHDKAMIEGAHPDVLPSDNNLGLPGVGEDAPSNTAEAAKRAAEAAHDAADKATGAWGWIAAKAKELGFGDKLHDETPSIPLPPERPMGYTGPGIDGNALHRGDEVGPRRDVAAPAIVPAPTIVPAPQPTTALAFHADDDRATRARASDAASWLDELGRRERESIFQFGQLNDTSGVLKASFATLDTGSGSAAQQIALLGLAARTAAGAMAGILAGGGLNGGGGGSGVIQAAYHPGGDGGFEGGSGGNMTPLLRGALPRGGGSRHDDGGSSAPNPYAGGAPGGDFIPPGAFATTAGMRQNNMGNIGFFGQHMAGLIGPSNAHDVDHSIAKFATQEDGIRAAAALALGKFHKGRRTTWDLIAAKGGWTPGALGPGASVNVARAMGIGNHDALNLDDEAQLVRFLHGLAVQEHGPAGRWFTEDRIRGALHHKLPETHPALAAPALPRRYPASHEPSAHITTARLEEKMERMTRAVERGGLHRLEIKDKNVKVAYSRGARGLTTA